MNSFKQWLRLINNQKPVGFLKILNDNTPLFSKDNYAWSTQKIAYEKAFHWSGIVDKNNYPLFENDIIALRLTSQPNPKKQYMIIFDETLQQFFFNDLNSDERLTLFAGKLPIINKQEITFIGVSI